MFGNDQDSPLGRVRVTDWDFDEKQSFTRFKMKEQLKGHVDPEEAMKRLGFSLGYCNFTEAELETFLGNVSKALDELETDRRPE